MDASSYLEIRSRSAAVFDLEARLPDQVFRVGAVDALFTEFDVLLTPDFWPALSAMAGWHGDAFVDLLVLEPELEDFYLPEYGIHPAASLPIEAGVDDYWASIGHEPNGDTMGSIAISAGVVAVTGRSGKWGCWGERDAEVAVFQGFPTMAVRDEWQREHGPFRGVVETLQTYLPLAFAARTVPDAYAARLLANYGPGR